MKKPILCLVVLFLALNCFAAGTLTHKTIYGALNKPHNDNYETIFDYLNIIDTNSDGVIDSYGYYVIDVSAMKDGDNAPAALDDASTRSPYAYRDFDDATQEDLKFTWLIPPDLIGLALNYKVYYLETNGTFPTIGEGVSFAMLGTSMGDGDKSNADFADGSAYARKSYIVDGSQYDIGVTDWSEDFTITNAAPGEVAEIKLARDVTDTNDDYAQDVGVFKIILRYLKSAVR